MWPWQVQCLQQPGVLTGRNLVYSAPTSSGKTLVAEILMARSLLQKRKKVLVILPLVSLVMEKVASLSRVFAPQGWRVQGFAGPLAGPAGLQTSDAEVDVALCTIEKANGLVNRLLEEQKTLDELGLVVLDEVHMMGDSDRGYILELLLTKLRFLAASTQLVCMSATLPNIAELQQWLDAALFISDFRPVALCEMVQMGPNLVHARTLQKIRPLPPGDPVIALCRETLSDGHSVLLFCASKAQCERECQRLATAFSSLLKPAAIVDSRLAVVAALRRTSTGLDPILAASVPHGVAYHHAGLTMEERDLIEDAFRNGVLVLLAATSTLAQGINLPARRVVFCSPFIGRSPLDGLRYRQMAGRAGRTGHDTQGESVLLATEEHQPAVRAMLTQPLQPLRTALSDDRKGMTRPVLEVIVSGVASAIPDIRRFIMMTLFAAQRLRNDVEITTKNALRWLLRHNFVAYDNEKKLYIPTRLGQATVASTLAPDEGLEVWLDLNRARKSLALDTELHLVFLCAPVHHSISPTESWDRLLALLESKDLAHEPLQRVAMLIGLDTQYVKSRGKQPPKPKAEECNAPDDASPERKAAATVAKNAFDYHILQARLHNRFVVAILLYELVREKPLTELCDHWRVPRGALQQMQTAAAAFAGMVATFCDRLGWWDLETLLKNYKDRFTFAVSAELLPLMRVPSMSARRARVLFAAGLKSVEHVAAASPEELERHFYKALPFNSQPHILDVEQGKRIEERTARLLVTSAQRVLAESSGVIQHTPSVVPKYLPATPQTPLSPPLLKPSPGTKTLSPDPLSPLPSSPSTRSVAASTAAGPNLSIFSPSLPTNKRIAQPDETKPTKVARVVPPATACTASTTLITTADDAAALVVRLRNALSFAIKLKWTPETPESSVMAVKLQLQGVGIVDNQGQSCYLVLPAYDPNNPMWKALRSLAECPGPRKIGYHLQQQLVVLLQHRISLTGELCDVHVAAWMLDPDTYSSEGKDSKCATLDALHEKFFGPSDPLPSDATPTQQAVHSAQLAHNLVEKLQPRLDADGLYDAFRKIEMPLVRVLAEMEYWGISFDSSNFNQYYTKLDNLNQEIAAQAHKLVGRKFQLESTKELSAVLYGDLQLPALKKTTKGKLSTNAEVLKQLVDKHQLPGLMLVYRKAAALLTRYVAPLPRCAVQHEVLGTRIHTVFQHTAVPTGRLATTWPNIQCIPHTAHWSQSHDEPWWRYIKCPALEGMQHVSLREAFVPAPGFVLLSADYSQLEVRLLAHFSEDPALLEMLRSPGGDLFRMVAADINSIPENEVTSVQRQHAKHLVYALLYGMGNNAIAELLGVSVPEAQQFQVQLRQRYPSVDGFLKQVVHECRKHGYVQSLTGRRRYLPDINSSNASDRARAERQAVNTVCQASAADLAKIAMNNIVRILHGRYPRPTELTAATQSPRLLVQIHDELLFEVPSAELVPVARIVREQMERAGGALLVPLRVNLSSGPNWAALANYPLE